MPKTDPLALEEPKASTEATGAGLTALVDVLMHGEGDDAAIDAWHAYADDSSRELHEEVIEARQVLHHGTPNDAVDLADRHVPTRARIAAERLVERQTA